MRSLSGSLHFAAAVTQSACETAAENFGSAGQSPSAHSNSFCNSGRISLLEEANTYPVHPRAQVQKGKRL